MKGDKQRSFQRKVLEEGLWEAQGSADDMWDKTTKGIRMVAKDTKTLSNSRSNLGSGFDCKMELK